MPFANQQEWGVKGFRTGAKSLEDVATKYEDMLRSILSTPYYIGWHHCGYIERGTKRNEVIDLATKMASLIR